VSRRSSKTVERECQVPRERPNVDRHLPVKPVAFQILLSLADGERHGYGITQDIAARTSARMRIEPGNLYRSLKAMLDAGLIEESERRPAPDLDDQRRRYYRITPLGKRVALAETARLEALVADARRAWLGKSSMMRDG
jgi:DNA-binding PadR family transcriptional regulator